MRTLAPTPREIIAASIWNSRGQPFTPLAAFEAIGGPRFNEYLPGVCQRSAGAPAAGAVAASPAPAATNRENE